MAGFQQQRAGWQERFLALLPIIVNYVAPAFRRLRADEQAEATQEAVANTYVAYSDLVKQGKEGLAFATVLAKYAIAQVRAGRQVGGRLNSLDVSSPYAQRRKRFHMASLDRYDSGKGCWQEVLVADDKWPILDQVAFKLDFPEWLATLRSRDQKIAQSLADGQSTSEVASQFGLSLGRVSQLRRKFEKSWLEFHGEEEAEMSG